MIKTLLTIILIIIINIIIFVIYPDTGKYGEYFFYGSIAFWSFSYIYISLNFKLFNTFPLSFIFKTLFFAFMIFMISIIVPQDDGKTILSKIMKRDFSDSNTINRGKIKYLKGLLSKPIKIDTSDIEKETKKIFDKIKN